MTQPASVGTLCRFALDTVSPPGTAYEYKGTFGLGKHEKNVAAEGIRGTHSHYSQRVRPGTYTCSGPIVLEPGPSDLDAFLPLITGGTKQGNNTFPLAETLTAFYVAIDRIADQFLYANCYVDKATFKSSEGQLLDLTLDVEAETETKGTVSGLTALIPTLTDPYIFFDATMTINGTAYQFKEVELVIDNHLKKDRFMNSVSRTDLPFLDRMVTVTLKHPYTSDTHALYDLEATTANVIITFVQGSNSLQFSMPTVQFDTEPPETPGREEILLPLTGMARAGSGGIGSELTITNVG